MLGLEAGPGRFSNRPRRSPPHRDGRTAIGDGPRESCTGLRCGCFHQGAKGRAARTIARRRRVGARRRVGPRVRPAWREDRHAWSVPAETCPTRRLRSDPTMAGSSTSVGGRLTPKPWRAQDTWSASDHVARVPTPLRGGPTRAARIRNREARAAVRTPRAPTTFTRSRMSFARNRGRFEWEPTTFARSRTRYARFPTTSARARVPFAGGFAPERSARDGFLRSRESEAKESESELRQRTPFVRDRDGFVHERVPDAKEAAPFARAHVPFAGGFAPERSARDGFLRSRESEAKESGSELRQQAPFVRDRDGFVHGRVPDAKEAAPFVRARASVARESVLWARRTRFLLHSRQSEAERSESKPKESGAVARSLGSLAREPTARRNVRPPFAPVRAAELREWAGEVGSYGPLPRHLGPFAWSRPPIGVEEPAVVRSVLGGGWGKSRPARTTHDDLPAKPAERGAPPSAEHRPDDGGRSSGGRPSLGRRP